MQKECAMDADAGVRAGCKSECALECPATFSIIDLIVRCPLAIPSTALYAQHDKSVPDGPRMSCSHSRVFLSWWKYF